MQEISSIMAEFGLSLDLDTTVLLLGLILARCLPLIVLTPFLAGQQAPAELRLGISFLLAVLVFPLVENSLSGPLAREVGSYLLLFLKEVSVGFVLGYVHAAIYATLDIAGRLIDTVRGSAMSEVLVPSSKLRATPIGSFYTQLFLAVFGILGGHALFIGAFLESFASIPIDQPLLLGPGLNPAVDFVCHTSAAIWPAAIMLSAPAVVATFVADVVFGILNRVAPQLNAYFMAMPVKALGAIILMLASFQPFFHRLVFTAVQSLNDFQTIIHLLSSR